MGFDRHYMAAIKKKQFGHQPFARIDEKDYIYFSRATMGINGKTIKVHRELILKFFTYLNPSSFKGQKAIRAIEALTARAGGLESLAKTQSAIEYMLHVGDIRIFYKIVQAEYGAPVTVYITDVKPGFTSNLNGGLYRITSNNGAQRLDPYPENTYKIVDNQGYINAHSMDEKQLISDSNASNPLKDNTTVFYAPSDVQNELGVFESKTKGRAVEQYAAKLSKVLKENASKNISWRVEGEGAGLLLETIKRENIKLDNYEFRLVNPIGKSPELVSQLKQNGAKIEERIISYTVDVSNQALISFRLTMGDMAPHMKGEHEAKSERRIATSRSRGLSEQMSKLGNHSDNLIDLLKKI